LYEKPSQEKIKIFNDWKSKLTRIYWLTWSKFNFTIYWSIQDQDWINHSVRITKSHNYILD
jgi:hypothetical protein